MIKKLTAGVAALALCGAPLAAQERTFITNPPTASNPGVTYNSGTDTVTATAADGARLYSTTRPIERGAKYRYEFTVSGYSAGGVQPYIGTIRDTFTAPTVAVTVSPASNPLSPGLTAIQDNFTTEDGLTSGNTVFPVDTTDTNYFSAFRMFCKTSHLANDDPLVVKNTPGAAHMHNFFGNTGTNAYSTYKSLRTSGGSSCQVGSQNAPINRTAYWFPAMLNGRGGVISAANINVYYKRHAVTATACTAPEGTRVGICVRVPNGLQMIWGYNMATMEQPVGDVPAFWQCRIKEGAVPVGDSVGTLAGPSVGDVRFASLQALRDAAIDCPIGASIVVTTQAPQCWDGTRAGSPDHRAHVTYIEAITARCPSSHPYYFSHLSHQIYWDVDENLNTWRLSSDDQMGMGVEAGETFHTDFMEAWSPAYKTRWHDGCIDAKRSCSGGTDGTGGATKGQAAITTNNSFIVPMQRLGLGVIRRKNGSFSGEFTAAADGEFGLNFLLFTGNVTGFKVTKIDKGGRGPVTTTTTQ